MEKPTIKDRNHLGTTITFRLSYQAKQNLLKKAKELDLSITDLINIAIQHSWGITCNGYD